MREQHVDIVTKDGAMNTFITYPEEHGPHPVVIFYMDAPGKREELHDMARRIATVGYYVLLPNLYYRDTREFHLGMPDATRERMFEMMNNISNAMVCEDTQSMFDFLELEKAASAGPVGITGYCMSGPFVFAAAAAFPERIKATASIHGVRLCIDAPTSPHLTADKIQGEMYFGCAETDAWAPPEMVEQLDAHLQTTGINYRIEWYPETEHGFVFPQRGEQYHKAAAERHWERLFAMFKRNLG
jgi:carboxymethylenebutenolidase